MLECELMWVPTAPLAYFRLRELMTILNDNNKELNTRL